MASAIALDSADRGGQGAAMSSTLLPENCLTMGEVRAGIDALDREIVALLARRFAYMDAAARIKSQRSQVRDEARKASVIAAAAREGERLGAPSTRIAELWDALVEHSIAYELEVWDRKAETAA